MSSTYWLFGISVAGAILSAFNWELCYQQGRIRLAVLFLMMFIGAVSLLGADIFGRMYHIEPLSGGVSRAILYRSFMIGVNVYALLFVTLSKRRI